MMDQCMHCTSKGNPSVCDATLCGKHEDWIVVRLRTQNAELVEALEVVKFENEQMEHLTSYSRDIVLEAIAKAKG